VYDVGGIITYVYTTYTMWWCICGCI